MIRDRHGVIRLAVNGAAPVVLLLGTLYAARTGAGLGGPVSAAWLLALAAGLHALLFGFDAARRRSPPALVAALAILAWLCVCAGLAANAEIVGRAGLEPPLEGPAARRWGGLLLGAGAFVAVAAGAISILTAVGARPRPLPIEEP